MLCNFSFFLASFYPVSRVFIFFFIFFFFIFYVFQYFKRTKLRWGFSIIMTYIFPFSVNSKRLKNAIKKIISLLLFKQYKIRMCYFSINYRFKVYIEKIRGIYNMYQKLISTILLKKKKKIKIATRSKNLFHFFEFKIISSAIIVNQINSTN